jgi:ABC-type nickel/cobalt efflux system permease component RcnA
MSEVSTISMLAFGFVLGLKHAIEADHIAAVSTIASEHASIVRSTFVGAFWGIGHTISLLIAGAAIVFLHIEIGGRVSLALEFAVGIMLIVLGANALRKIIKGGRLHMHVHEHGGRLHAHPHVHHDRQHDNVSNHHGLKLHRRPLIVGMIHGLAGSGALMLLVLATIRQPLLALGYVLVFGLGSTGGMMLMSALVGLPAILTAQRFARANMLLRAAAAAFSVVLGCVITYQLGFITVLH